MNFGDRVKAEREAKSWTQLELAQRAGIKQQDVQAIESRSSKKSMHAPMLAKVLGRTLGYMLTGTGPRDADGDALPEITPAQRGEVPLISWVTAGAWHTLSDPYAVGDAEKWIPCPVRHGPRSFALRIRGISMFNPGSKPSFEEGDIGFFDPDVTPQPNTRLMQSCVVVRLEDKHDSTFKQLIEEGGRRYLKALNPTWPEPIIEVNADATICGVAIGKWVE